MPAVFFLYPHARHHAKGAGDGGEHGDQDLENFFPVNVFHGMIYDL